MHSQQQEYSSYSSVLGRLHSYTEANHLHDNMGRHIHTSWILSCLHCPSTLFFVISLSYSSALGWHHFCPVVSTINWIILNIFFIYVWIYVCIYVIFIIFWYLFICCLPVCVIPCFPFLLLHFLRKFRLNYTHKLNKHTWLIIVSYFVNTFYCTNFMFLHEIFEVFQLTFSFFHHNVDRYTFTWECKAMVT